MSQPFFLGLGQEQHDKNARDLNGSLAQVVVAGDAPEKIREMCAIIGRLLNRGLELDVDANFGERVVSRRRGPGSYDGIDAIVVTVSAFDLALHAGMRGYGVEVRVAQLGFDVGSGECPHDGGKV